ncbi:MAG: NAD(P)-dependent dehydrogenase (short-subunit alcohol dehydrogenase family) [Halioglobus sp.]|jgi:NAD(P)-dependent dehydrogenase (short-subunit alcohol dehydrogenase family)
MSEFAGKTAVISGGAEGIGFGIARALGQQGMNIVLGDIDAQQLQQAQQTLTDEGVDVLAVTMDVTDIGQWQRLAEQALQRFGKIHMLVNNAGVSGIPGEIDVMNAKGWQWVMDVNLMGVVYGTQTMVPLMKQHGEGGWLVNVASMAGMGGIPFGGPYTASKIAVVGMSESWNVELQPHNIQVSVLCPGFVKTRIHLSHRNKHAHYQSDESSAQQGEGSAAAAGKMQDVIDAGLDPMLVGSRVLEALVAQELYIFTHPNYRSWVQKRFADIDAAFERSESSPLLADVVNQKMVNFT